MQFKTLADRRHIIKSATILAAGAAAGTGMVAAQTPDSTPELENDGEFTSVNGDINLTWDTEVWELWEEDEERVVIGSNGDGSAPYAYRLRSTVSERFWKDGEAGLESYESTGNSLSGDDVTVFATHADTNTMGYIRRSMSPGGEAYSIFEFTRASEDENIWVSSEAWIHVDAFDAEDAIAQFAGITLNGAPVPSVWTIEEAIELIAEDAG